MTSIQIALRQVVCRAGCTQSHSSLLAFGTEVRRASSTGDNMPSLYSGVKFRDQRSGQWRSARHYERNRHFKVDTLSKGLASFVFKSMDDWADRANDFADELRQYA